MKKGIVRMVELKEGYQVYTRTVGKGIPILFLHGGPGCNHHCFEIFENYVDLTKFSLVYYDQLGSAMSDKIKDRSLLSLPRYVDEVEQVRDSLGLDKFILLGHSWGGMLCMEYSLKYEKDGHLIGMIISNMVDSIERYLRYLDIVRKTVLTPEEYTYMANAEKEHHESEERYQKLVEEKLNPASLCRLSPKPDFLKEENVPAKEVYNFFQGDNEFVVTGAMLGWDRSEDIQKIQTKTLVFGAKYDTMDPARIEEMGRIIPNGQSYICPNGSHCCFWDDSENYFNTLNDFIEVL